MDESKKKELLGTTSGKKQAIAASDSDWDCKLRGGHQVAVNRMGCRKARSCFGPQQDPAVVFLGIHHAVADELQLPSGIVLLHEFTCCHVRYFN